MHFMDDCFVNLGEEVILTFIRQSGASESATVYFVISLSISYWLLRVCARECVRERERYRVRSLSTSAILIAACKGVCVWGGGVGGGHVYVVYEDTNLYNDMGMT